VDPKLIVGVSPVVCALVSSTVQVTVAVDPDVNSTTGLNDDPVVVNRTYVGGGGPLLPRRSRAAV
jgi:hypothetical protein